jgi:hypothetical protein
MWLDKEPEYGLDHPELVAQWQTDWNIDNFDPEGITEALGNWLESTEYEIALRVWHREYGVFYEGSPISLMELLELWLYRGNGLVHCPSYESFLAATIRIIDHWHRHGCKEIDGRPIWWDSEKEPNGGDGKSVAVPLFPADSRREHNPRDDHGYLLLRQESYLRIQALHRQKEHEAFTAKVDQILATLKGDTPD